MGKYWGQFLNGLKHGQGIYYLSDDSKFVGDFKNDESMGPCKNLS